MNNIKRNLAIFVQFLFSFFSLMKFLSTELCKAAERDGSYIGDSLELMNWCNTDIIHLLKEQCGPVIFIDK